MQNAECIFLEFSDLILCLLYVAFGLAAATTTKPEGSALQLELFFGAH